MKAPSPGRRRRAPHKQKSANFLKSLIAKIIVKKLMKTPFESKTYWGIALMVLPTALGLFGLDVDTAAVETYVEPVKSVWAMASELVGLVLAIYGRWVAEKPISLRPKA